MSVSTSNSILYMHSKMMSDDDDDYDGDSRSPLAVVDFVGDADLASRAGYEGRGVEPLLQRLEEPKLLNVGHETITHDLVAVEPGLKK
jgi:hypothetical protein